MKRGTFIESAVASCACSLRLRRASEAAVLRAVARPRRWSRGAPTVSDISVLDASKKQRYASPRAKGLIAAKVVAMFWLVFGLYWRSALCRVVSQERESFAVLGSVHGVLGSVSTVLSPGATQWPFGGTAAGCSTSLRSAARARRRSATLSRHLPGWRWHRDAGVMAIPLISLISRYHVEFDGLLQDILAEQACALCENAHGSCLVRVHGVHLAFFSRYAYAE